MSAKKADVEALQKQCLKVLQGIKRKREAYPFLEPVDWKALELPLYPKLIKKPMDLGTVEQKLQETPCAYKTVAAFSDDVNLIWSNAQLFNLDGSDIYSFASSCKEAFEAKMADVDSHGALREGASKEARESLGGDELAACKKAIGDLKKNKNAELFLAPVDWKGLGLTNYLDVIKKPMDLGTVGTRLEGGKYASTADVASDVELIWTNAMTYNLDGSYVFEAALAMKAETKKKFASMSASGGGSSKDGGGGGGGSTGSAKKAANSSGGGGGSGSGSGGAAAAVALSDQLIACKKAIGDLNKNKNAEVFLAPVDWKGLGLTNYLDVIKKPMDLGTVGTRLEGGKYASALDVACDIDQIWINAMTYNAEGSPVYKAAAELKKMADVKMAPLVAAARAAGEVPQEVSFEMLRQLNDDVAHLTPLQLCRFLSVVQEACTRAVKDTAGEGNNLAIDLDELDMPAFTKIDKFVSEAIGAKRKRK